VGLDGGLVRRLDFGGDGRSGEGYQGRRGESSL